MRKILLTQMDRKKNSNLITSANQTKQKPIKIRTMIKRYLSTRKELTERLKLYTVNGFICRRVRETCKCHPILSKPEMYPKANQRNAVIVFD